MLWRATYVRWWFGNTKLNSVSSAPFSLPTGSPLGLNSSTRESKRNAGGGGGDSPQLFRARFFPKNGADSLWAGSAPFWVEALLEADSLASWHRRWGFANSFQVHSISGCLLTSNYRFPQIVKFAQWSAVPQFRDHFSRKFWIGPLLIFFNLKLYGSTKEERYLPEKSLICWYFGSIVAHQQWTPETGFHFWINNIQYCLEFRFRIVGSWSRNTIVDFFGHFLVFTSPESSHPFNTAFNMQ